MPTSQLVNRFKSFLWRAGMMAFAAFIAFAAANVGDLELGPTTTVILGLILGEVSKALNSRKS